jgi:hypothetical protein
MSDHPIDYDILLSRSTNSMPPQEQKRNTWNLVFLALSILGVLVSLWLPHIDTEEFPHALSTDFFIFLFVSVLSGLTLLEPRLKGRLQTFSAIVQMLVMAALVLVALYAESSRVRAWVDRLRAHPQPLEIVVGTGVVFLVVYGFVRIESRFPTTCAVLETFGLLLVVGYGVFVVVNKHEMESYVAVLAAALALLIPLRHFVDRRK